MTTASPKAPLYSVNDLKNTTTDTIPIILSSHPFSYKSSHTHTHIRLALGYAAVLFAAAVFALDYRYGWDATKDFTFYACIVYFVLNGLLTAWVWLGENGLIFDGTRDSGETLRVWALTEKEKWTSGFAVKAQWTGETGKGEREVRGKFTEWFDEKGFMVEVKLREWLVGALPVLKGTMGKVDGSEKEALGNLGQIDGGVDTPAKATPKKGRKKG